MRSFFFHSPFSWVFQPVFLQDNALGMPTDLSALLMVASCSSQVKISWIHSRYLFTPVLGQQPLQSVGIHKFLCMYPICSADFKLWGDPTGDLITGRVKIPDLGRARKTTLLFWINIYLSQNWHWFRLIKPTTKEWPLSTQACQTLDSHRQSYIP